MFILRITSLIFIILLLLFTTVHADNTKLEGQLVIKNVWSRATLARNGVVYLTIYNHGDLRDTLIGAESSVSKKVEFHNHIMINGILRMRPVATIEIQPRKSLILEPGGKHIMLIGLYQNLQTATSFPLTLKFEKHGTVEVKVTVVNTGTMKFDSHNKHHKTSG